MSLVDSSDDEATPTQEVYSRGSPFTPVSYPGTPFTFGTNSSEETITLDEDRGTPRDSHGEESDELADVVSDQTWLSTWMSRLF